MELSAIPTDPETLNQLSKIELVQIIIAQQKIIDSLQQKIEKLKISQNLNSKNSSLPPSTDLIKKSEKEVTDTEERISQKRKPGGQPGHIGKTRIGFARVDRIEILKPKQCTFCESNFEDKATIKVEKQQVAQLVEKPIEIVEYHRYHCQCDRCDGITAAEWSKEIIPGQDLGVKLQALLGWLGNYGHLPSAILILTM